MYNYPNMNYISFSNCSAPFSHCLPVSAMKFNQIYFYVSLL